MDRYTQSSKAVKYFASIISHSRIIRFLHTPTYIGQKYRQRIGTAFLTEGPLAKAERKGKEEEPDTRLHLYHFASERKRCHK